jgi:uncharacterized protein (DUF302 family)
METTLYSYYKTVDMSYQEAIDKVTEVLKKEGFGILTEIDVKATLKKKLDVDFRPYKILGACNPPYAHKALVAEEQIGLMLPCNVVVYENENGETVVAAIDPIASMQAVNNPNLGDIAVAIREKMQSVIEKM